MKRVLCATVIAVSLASAGCVVVRHALGVDIPDVCKSITPDNWFLWWYYSCDRDASGGGGSGAS